MYQHLRYHRVAIYLKNKSNLLYNECFSPWILISNKILLECNDSMILVKGYPLRFNHFSNV